MIKLSRKYSDKNRGFISYLVIGSLALSSVLGLFLYKQIQANGVLKANTKQLQQAITDTKAALTKAENERKRAEIIVLDNLETKEIIEVEVEKEVEIVREIIKQVPAGDCLNTVMPDDIIRLFREGGSDEAGDSETISPSSFNTGYTSPELTR